MITTKNPTMKTINRNRFNNLITLLNEGQDTKARIELNRKESKKGHSDFFGDYHIYAIPKDKNCKHYVYKQFSMCLMNAVMELIQLLRDEKSYFDFYLIKEISAENVEVAKLFFEYSKKYHLDSSRGFDEEEIASVVEFLINCQKLLETTDSFYLMLQNNYRGYRIKTNRMMRQNGRINPDIIKRKVIKKTSKSNAPQLRISGADMTTECLGFEVDIDFQCFPSLNGLTLKQIKHRIERWKLPAVEQRLLKALTDYYYNYDDCSNGYETEKIESI
jgi:hypothetical protein